MEQEVTYKNGKKNGLAYRYYENGTLRWEVTFKNGKWNGLEKDYYESGALEQEVTYKNGKFLKGVYIDVNGVKTKWNVLPNGMCEGIKGSKRVYYGLQNDTHCN